MKLTSKEYRHIDPYISKQQDDVQGTVYEEKMFSFLFFFEKGKCARYSSSLSTMKQVDVFGKTHAKKRKKKLEQFGNYLSKNKDPVTVGHYKCEGDKITMNWEFRNTKIVFKGQVMLKGDAIKGAFFKNGKVNNQERVYYNMAKPLPDILIENGASF